VEKPAEHAVRTALAIQEAFVAIAAHWKKRGYDLGLGIGIAQGYATVGAVGFEGRIDYGAIGTVTNVANRLCDLAAAGSVLASQRVVSELGDTVRTEDLGEVVLHGLKRPVRAFRLLGPAS